MKKVNFLLILILSVFFVNVNAQETQNLKAKFSENFLTYQNNKTTVSFIIEGTRGDFQKVITTSKKYKKYSTFEYKNNRNNTYDCKLTFDKYENPISNLGFVQKMLINYNIEYFTYKGNTYEIKDFVNATQK